MCKSISVQSVFCFRVGPGSDFINFKSKTILSMESLNMLVCWVMFYASVSDADDFF